jgi:UDP-N-acetylglucosamine transferase subunit ALG13
MSTQPEPRESSRVLFVCDSGGHLMEAIEVARTRYAGWSQSWYTSNTSMARSLLAGRDVTFARRRVLPKRVDLAVRELLPAVGHLRSRPVDLVVSTGSAYAIPWMVAARICGVPALFIESAARTTSISRVGSLVARVPGVTLATQEPFRLEGWISVPNVLSTALADAVPVVRPAQGPPSVLVTVGTFPFAFDRLVDRVLAIVPPAWELVVQHGVGRPPGRGAAVDYLGYEEMERAFRQADVVIGHCGVGTVLTGARTGSHLLLAPRRARHREVVDDHQTQLGPLVAAHPQVRVVDDVADLTFDRLDALVRRARGQEAA